MKCPICKTPTTWNDNPSRPFCSERCKSIDLGNWINGNYFIPQENSENLESDSSSEVNDLKQENFED